MRFSVDALPGYSWAAEALGQPWNGWATPVVTRDVPAEVLIASGEPHRWDADEVLLGTPAVDLRLGEEPELWEPVRSREDGLFDLGQMGWTFVRVDQSHAAHRASSEGG